MGTYLIATEDVKLDAPGFIGTTGSGQSAIVLFLLRDWHFESVQKRLMKDYRYDSRDRLAIEYLRMVHDIAPLDVGGFREHLRVKGFSGLDEYDDDDLQTIRTFIGRAVDNGEDVLVT